MLNYEYIGEIKMAIHESQDSPEFKMLKIPKFEISLKSDPSKKFEISAKSKHQAWCKFCAQKFDALKPDPKDWKVVEIKSA